MFSVITCLYTFKSQLEKTRFRTADPAGNDDPRLECGTDPWNFAAQINWEGAILHTVNVIPFSKNIVILCRTKIDFPLISDSVGAREPTSNDASSTIAAETVIMMNRRKLTRKLQYI
ncbi:hypothetical protein CDAR_288301 [Caerostris darwini]|uniref:Uncharacterized protein n=1 Tax=Caerostris darwini TaxID=1538125 RepID=A0AAV4RD15_9ARAC|nr:hypothetical protein CDAR_288301 [Caerostris darwini]